MSRYYYQQFDTASLSSGPDGYFAERPSDGRCRCGRQSVGYTGQCEDCGDQTAAPINPPAKDTPRRGLNRFSELYLDCTNVVFTAELRGAQRCMGGR